MSKLLGKLVCSLYKNVDPCWYVLIGGVLMVSFSVRCEQLLGVNGKLRQELMLIGEPIPELQERLGQLLQALIQRYKHKGSKQLHLHRSSSPKDV